MYSIILALVEGLTEFLPISSTAHLMIVSEIMGIPQSDFWLSFEIIIQFGAILAVVLVYYKLLIKNIDIWLKIITAFIPTAIVGFVLYKLIKGFLLENLLITALALGTGGILIILFENHYNKFNQLKDVNSRELQDISYKKAFVIGLCQSLAIVPGVSRAGATIIGGLLMGIERRVIVEFSFLLALPTIASASLFDLIKNKEAVLSMNVSVLIVGIVFAFISALFAIKFFIKYISNNSFKVFGYYRIFIALALCVYLISK